MNYHIINLGCSSIVAELLARRFMANGAGGAQEYEYGGITYRVKWGKTGIVVRAL